MIDDSLALFSLWPEGLLHRQWWRLWTAHLVHVNPLHWLSNLLALLVLRCWSGPGFWRLALGYWLLAAPVLSWLLLLVRPDLAWYAGASGLLWGLAVVVLLKLPLHQAGPWLLLVSTLLWLESQHHGTALVGGAEAVPEAHLLGALVGLLVVAAGRIQLLWGAQLEALRVLRQNWRPGPGRGSEPRGGSTG